MSEPSSTLSQRLVSSLERSALVRGSEAISVLRAGWQIEAGEGPPHPVPCALLAQQYARTLRHVRASHSPYALEHVAELDEFVGHLRAHRDASGHWYRVRGGEEHLYAVFCLLPSEEPIGCLRTIDGQMVTDARWRELWGF